MRVIASVLVLAQEEATGEGLLLPVVGGVMLVTLCALAIGLTLGKRQKKAPRKPRRNPFETPVPEEDPPTPPEL